MPVPLCAAHQLDNVCVVTHRSAQDIPQDVWAIWRRHETAANVMLPNAESALRRESAGALPTLGQLWISLSSRSTFSDGVRPCATVDFVLSCTEWAMGTYPIFIFCNPVSLQMMLTTTLEARISMLADELSARVPIERVYSVFAPTLVTKIFARVWCNKTGAQIESEAYYSAIFSYCTEETLIQQTQPSDGLHDYVLRLANDWDVQAVADLCYGFALTSVRQSDLAL